MTNETDRATINSTVRTTGLSLGVAAALWLLGRGALSTPPVDSWTQLQRWLADRSTAEAAIATLRATGAIAACYLGAITGLTLVARIASFDRLDRIARSLLPRSLRPLIGVAVGAGVATAAASMTVPPRDVAPTHVATVTLESPTDATATMYIVSDSLPPSTVASLTAPSTTITTTAAPPTVTATPSTAVTPSAPAPTPPTPHTWTIARGDHLWAVASETLADAWHRPPTDREIVPYWHDLIELNRSRLVDPANADYVLAGQVFVLPDVPSVVS